MSRSGWLCGLKTLQNIYCLIERPHTTGIQNKSINKMRMLTKISSCPSLWSLLLQVVVHLRYGLLCCSTNSRRFYLYYFNHSSFKAGNGHCQFHVVVLKQRNPRRYFTFPLYGTSSQIIKSSRATKSFFTPVSVDPDSVSKWAFLDQPMPSLNAPPIFLKATTANPSRL